MWRHGWRFPQPRGDFVPPVGLVRPDVLSAAVAETRFKVGGYYVDLVGSSNPQSSVSELGFKEVVFSVDPRLYNTCE